MIRRINMTSNSILDLKELFHFYIYTGDTDNIREHLCIVQPHDKHVMNKYCESAVASALRNNRLDIYELLLKEKLRLTANEDFQKIINKVLVTLSDDERNSYEDRLSLIHQKYAQNINVPYLDELILKCKSSHDGDDSIRWYREFVSQMFEELNEIEFIVPILKLVSQDEKLEITFDFNKSSTEVMVPWTDGEMHGLTGYNTGKVSVGAKDYQENDKKSTINGVLVHELCHYAMHLTYSNDYGKPYDKMDIDREQEYQRVIENSKVFKDFEEIIYLVFNYEKSEWEKELIVRVPHILAHYKHDSKKVENIQWTFKPLFHFYHSVLQDVETKFMEMESENKVKELNEKFGLLESWKNSKSKLSKCRFIKNKELYYLTQDENKVKFIVSNFSKLTMQAIYQHVCDDQKLTPLSIFVHQNRLNDQKTVEKIKEVLNSVFNSWLIIDCSELKFVEGSVLHDLFNDSTNQRIVYVYESNQVKKLNVKHVWNHLTQETQTFLLSENIKFQGESLKLEEILPLGSIALEDIPLKKLFSGKLEVGLKIEANDEKSTIKRRFHAIRDSGFSLKNITIEQIIDNAESSKVLLLSNEPGMGKTTEFKLMAKRIKKAHPEFWVIFIDLKQHVKAYEKDGKLISLFETKNEVANHFQKKIMKIRDFEAKVFSQLLGSERVVFLMDGFDEISPSYKEFNLKLTKALMTLTKNQVWISTRPHLAQELKNELKLDLVNKLMPFSEDDECKFIEMLFKAKKIRNIQKINKANEVFRTLEDQHGSISNPLILRMIVEVVVESEFNIFDDKELNLHLIYQFFFKKSISILYDKGEQAIEELQQGIVDSNDVKKHLKKIALKTLLIGIFSQHCEDLIASPYFENLHPINNEQLARTGLVTLGPSNEMEFIHRTFAEYLFAEFTIEELCDSKGFDGHSAFHSFWHKFNFDEENGTTVSWKFLYSAAEQRFKSLPDSQGLLNRISNHIKILDEEEVGYQYYEQTVSWSSNWEPFIFQIHCINLILKREHWFYFYFGHENFSSDLIEKYVPICPPEDVDELKTFFRTFMAYPIETLSLPLT